jgi:ABC-2 type transport system ATP-binding protein
MTQALSAPAISLEAVGKRFGAQVVLDGVDLRVAGGEIVALLGPNGAGKTTAVGILSTLVRPDSGRATVAGFDVVAEPQEVRRRISLTGQSAAVDPVLTAEENLGLVGRLAGLDGRGARRRGRELLERFDLVAAARKPVRTFSGGMRRRLDLALGLVATPEVVFLDEPTTGLDTRSRQELWEGIRELAAQGTTVLLTTQYLEEADVLADRIAVLDRGRIVAEGSAAALKAQVGGEVVGLHGADGTLLRELPTDGTPAGLRRALDELGAGPETTVSLRRPSLDDVFLALTTTGTTTTKG